MDNRITCDRCGNTDRFYLNASISSQYLFNRYDDDSYGWVQEEDDKSSFIRIRKDSFSITLIDQEKLVCADCGNTVEDYGKKIKPKELTNPVQKWRFESVIYKIISAVLFIFALYFYIISKM